ncbi:MAG: hypothetical protein U0744_18025 [Gemmataceae bacterium]
MEHPFPLRFARPTADGWVIPRPVDASADAIRVALAPMRRQEEEPTTGTLGLLLLAGVAACVTRITFACSNCRRFAYAIYPVGKLLLPTWIAQ